MTAFGGFYVTPEAYSAWVNSNPNRRPWAFGETAAQDLIREALREKKLEDYFHVKIVPVPPSEPDYKEDLLGMMLVRREAHQRVYIAQRRDSRYDMAGRSAILEYIGLEASAWKTLWFDEECAYAPYDAAFLEPEAPTESGKAKILEPEAPTGSGKAKNEPEDGPEMEAQILDEETEHNSNEEEAKKESEGAQESEVEGHGTKV